MQVQAPCAHSAKPSCSQLPFNLSSSWQDEIAPLTHVHGGRSLTAPLQFSSWLSSLQSSGLVVVQPVTGHAPFVHVIVMLAQSPFALATAPQLEVVPFTHWQPSLTFPLQLSSLLGSQVSAALGATAPMQSADHAPAASHVCVPAVQLPTAAPQARCVPATHGQPSLRCPLQFESSSG